MTLRKVKAWLVSDCGGMWSDAYELPAIAFTDEGMARECARVRESRMETDCFGERGWCTVRETEVVICG